MRQHRTVRHVLKCIAPLCVAAGLVFAATQADAYYGSYRGGYYGGHYGGYYGGYRHYGYRGGYYRGYRSGHYYGGYPYRRYSYGGAYTGYSYPQSRLPSSTGAYDGGSNPAPQSNSGASREYDTSGVADGGWSRLAGGQYSAALSIFAAQATSQPKAGKPKVGYALSAAATGNLRRGIWAMRRAIRIDPDSIHYVTIDQSLRPRIEQLIARYQSDPYKTSGNADAAFMRASLHYLLGNAKSARGQVDLAVAAGDRSSSTVNLERLIDKQIDVTPRPDEESD